jgi:MoaA/NifB/PqqE/SkfB family radical SAM enzyme
MINYSDIRTVHLEISTRCNAACPMCPRNANGTDADLDYPLHDMSLAEAKRIFSVDFIKQLTYVFINGNFGDFVTAKDGLEIVKYFNETNPNMLLEIYTNGSARPNWWSELGKMSNIVVGFDIDGLADTHSLYRRNTNWDVVINNAKKFIDAGGQATWRFISFDHNKHQIEACKQMAKGMGFKNFHVLPSDRDHGPVYDADGNFSYAIGKLPLGEREYNPRLEDYRRNIPRDNDPEYRKKIYKITPADNKLDCWSKKYNGIYVTATGEIYPCCFLGFYPKIEYKGHPWQKDNFGFSNLVKNNNALETTLEDTIEWFAEVERSWIKKSYSEGRIYRCDEACGSKSNFGNLTDHVRL